MVKVMRPVFKVCAIRNLIKSLLTPDKAKINTGKTHTHSHSHNILTTRDFGISVTRDFWNAHKLQKCLRSALAGSVRQVSSHELVLKKCRPRVCQTT